MKRPIHIACKNGHGDLVRILIEKNCDIECEDWNDWRPIHLACEKGHVDIVRLLIENHCVIECRTNQRKAPLDLAKSKNQDSCVQFLKKYKNTISNIEEFIKRKEINELINKINSLNSTKEYKSKNTQMDLVVLETSLNRNMERIIDLMAAEMINDKLLPVLSNILNITTFEKRRLFLKEQILIRCNADVDNSSRGIVNSSFLEVAASTGSRVFIDKIMKKTVYKKETWKRATEIALQNGHERIAEDIADREFILSSRLKRNFSLLHTAVCDNDADMVGYLLRESIVNADMNHEIFGTALALAHSLCHRKCIAVLERFNVNINTQNKFGQSPLHEAVASGTHVQCRYLMERCEEIDKEGFNKLTALQCSVMEGCADLCDQLMQYGANCTRYIKESIGSSKQASILLLTDRENSLTLCVKLNRTIYPCFLPILNQDTSNCCDGSNNSLLHLAVFCLQPDLCKSLLDKGALITAINNKGNTCLLELLSNIDEPIEDNTMEQIVNVVNILVEYGDDVNAVSCGGLNVFQLAYKFNNEKLMIALLSQSPIVTNVNEDDFNLAIEKKWFKYLDMLIKWIPKRLITSFIMEQIIMKCLPNSSSSLIKYLFENAQESVQQSVIEEILLDATTKDNKDLFEYLLNRQVEQPKIFDNGENLFTSLLREKKEKYIWNLMRSQNFQFYGNLKNKEGQLPLQVAIELDEMEIVDNLSFYTNDINNKDRNGETALMQLLKKISICDNVNIERNLMRTIRIMITRGGDIYLRITGNKEIIDLCSRPDLRNEIIKFSKS